MEHNITCVAHLNVFNAYYKLLFTPLDLDHETKRLRDKRVGSYAIHILDAKNDWATNDDVAVEDLLIDQQHNLFNILSKHKKLSNGSLGVYLHTQLHIELKCVA